MGRRAGAGSVYRGSRKRVRRLKWQEHTSVEFWIFVILMLIMLFVGIPWLIRHPPETHHHHLFDE
jgi:uncharacterized iron-regulated membrane protein